MAKIKLFTHTDLDGVGCAILAKIYAKHRNQSVNIEFCQNNEVDDAVNKYFADGEYEDYDMCYITDLSVNPETAERINNIFAGSESLNIRLLDHHPTATWLNKYVWAHVLTTEGWSMRPTCGTKLFYHYLFCDKTLNSRLRQFVDDVNYWDTWTWQESGLRMPQLYNTALHLIGREAFMEDLLPKLLDEVDLPDGWEELVEREEKNKKDYMLSHENSAFECEYNGDKYLAVFAGRYISEFGNHLSTNNPDYKGVFLIGDGTVSLRTCREDVDLSEIAKKFGGGGHKQAAGFMITPEKKKAILDIIFEQSK